uniref:Uncharacterized protein n=1 Tax=Arundo donax TaxID=35708 RepID=A0A0A9GNP1_ARUDO
MINNRSNIISDGQNSSRDLGAITMAARSSEHGNAARRTTSGYRRKPVCRCRGCSEGRNPTPLRRTHASACRSAPLQELPPATAPMRPHLPRSTLSPRPWTPRAARYAAAGRGAAAAAAPASWIARAVPLLRSKLLGHSPLLRDPRSHLPPPPPLALLRRWHSQLDRLTGGSWPRRRRPW